MRSRSLSTKLIFVFLFLAVAAYFSVQAYRYFVDPQTTTLVYAYSSEDAIAATGYLARYEGLRIPKNALRVDADGSSGVYCLVGLRAYRKPVEVLWQGEDYCLVRPVGIETTSESLRQLYTLRAGDEAIVSANDLYDGKVVE